MANDIGTISILVDSSQVRSATQDIKDLGNSSNSAAKSASIFMQNFAKAAAQSARDAQYLRDVARANQEIINTNLKVSNSYSSAEESAAAFTRELRAQELQAQKTARANQDAVNKQLGVNRPSAVSAGAGFGAIEAEILRLESMYNKVAVAARVYEQAQESLNKAVMMGVLTSDQKEAKLLELTLAYQKVGTSADKAQAFINQFGENAQVTGRGLNRFGMIAQQVGYQVGDFFVQVQSGTNPMVAFGQQATQLAGLIPGVLGAALGIGISLVTALGAAWMRTSENLMSSQEAVKGLTDKIRSLNEETANIKGVQTLPDEVISQLSRQEDIMLEMLVLQEQLAEKERVVNEFREAGITQGVAYQAALAEVLATERQIAELEKERADNSELLLEYQEALLNKRKALADQEERSLSQELALLQEKIKYGEDSVQVKALENQQTVENYAEELRRLGLHQSIIDALVAQKEEVIAAGAELENATASAENLENALQAAASAMAQLSGFSAGLDVKIAQAAARVEALKDGANAANAAMAAGLRAEAEQRRDAAARVAVGADQLRRINAEYADSIAKINELDKLNATFDEMSESQKKAAGGAKKLKEELTAAQKAAQDFANAMDGYVVGAVDGVANAFGDFVMRGFKDFKGFVKNIIGSFKNMLAQMIALAARNQILIGLGFAAPVAGAVGGAAMGAGFGAGVAGAGAATGIGAAFGSAASGLSSGFMTSVYGGLGGTVGAVSGGLSVGGISGISTAIGAIAAPLLAVAAVFSFFKKKTKELDSGLRITVGNMDALVETFRTVQTTRFWGLSKKTTTTVGEADAEISDPIVKAVQDIQTQVLKAAEMFGIAESEFEDFVYKFDVSLKDLTDEQKIQKVNEELLKMGDAFASLSGHFTSMNELLAAAQQRYDLTTRLLELQGNAEELLRRSREAELASVHELNRSLLLQVYALEDAQRALDNYNRAVANTASAASDLRSAMDRELSTAQTNMDAARAQLEKAVQKRVQTIQAGFARVFASIEAQIDSAKAKAESSRRIFELLDNALSGRSAVSEAGAFASRRAAMAYVSSGGMDVDKLTSALGVLNEPSEQFFGTFQDYARDFALTTNAIQQSRAIAEATMTADEKAVQLLEQSLEQARSSEARQIAAVEELLVVNEEVLTVEEAMAQYLEAQATYEQVQAQHQELIAQFPMLNESVLSVADAILALNAAIAEQTAAQTAVANAIASAANVSTGDIPGFAVGGMHIGGPRIVGENGPELEVTGPSRIYSNRDTASMFRDPNLASAVDGLRKEVSGMRSEQLQIQVEVSKNVKRIYDIERKWDTDGLPPERV